MKFQSLALILGIFPVAVFAQNDKAATSSLTGSISLHGGLGNSNPFSSDWRLMYKSQKFSINPYINYNIYTDKNEGLEESAAYRYSKSGSLYSSSLDQVTNGKTTRSGFDAQWNATQRTTLKMKLDGIRTNLDSRGDMFESLKSSSSSDSNTDLGNGTFKSLLTPTLYDYSLNTQIGLQQQIGKADMLRVSYNLNYQNTENNLVQTSKPGNTANLFEYRKWDREVETYHHNALVDYRHVISPTQYIIGGIRYEQRNIEANDHQVIDQTLNQETGFKHQMKSYAASVEYGLNLKPFSVTARLEYIRTKMGGKDLNDFVPNLMLLYRLSKGNSLRLSYMMRLIRPNATLLNSTVIYGAYTQDYGVHTLEGTHANVIALTHGLKQNRFSLNTTLSHIFANDGFNAIWMVKDVDGREMRVSFWGNEGIRKAWSISPDLDMTLMPSTQLGAKVTLLWDKRIAEAINMAKEHWGITAQVRLAQRLPNRFMLRLNGEYSEGNTIDLYSHASRAMKYNGELQRSFLKGDALNVSLAYTYQEYATTILTQGMYTGRVNSHPADRYSLMLNTTMKF